MSYLKLLSGGALTTAVESKTSSRSCQIWVAAPHGNLSHVVTFSPVKATVPSWSEKKKFF